MQTTELSNRTRRRRVTFRGAAIASLIAAGLAALFFVVLQKGAVSQKTPAAAHVGTLDSHSRTPIRTVPVRSEKSSPITEALSGVLEARHTVTVSAEVADRLVTRPVERGQQLRRGSTIAFFDDRTTRATLAEAQAALASATAARRQAEAEYERAQTETASAIVGAQATLAGASAGERKARTFTRTQELRQAEAALSQALTDENLAKIERERYARLVAEGAIAQQTLDRTQATFDSAQARTRSAREAVSLAQEGARQEDIAQAASQVQSARANLDSAQSRPARLAAIREQIHGLQAAEARAQATIANVQVQLSKHCLTSPLAGRVLETRMEAGEMASPGAPVVVVADVRDLRAIFSVPESARPRLKQGQRVTLTSDAIPGRTFPARIATLGFQGDGKTRTFRIEVAVSNPNEQLLPNMTARLSLPIGVEERRISVPIAAVATDAVTGETFILEINANGETLRRPVTLGEPIGTDAVQIRSGLNGTEKLAADPARAH